MNSTEGQNDEAEAEKQATIDRAVEESLNLDFTSFEDVKEAFQN